MRIIAGSARGHTIHTPKGWDTRPTQDYVRESLFNILQRETPGAHVLDLFAGSGALGLEALSRGAETAVLADCAPEAITCIHRNVEALRFADRASVLRGDWQTVLSKLAGESRRFTLVFLDPPYRMENTDTQCARLADLGLLTDEALIVVQHRRGLDSAPDGRFSLCDKRRYGETEIHFYTYAQGGV